MWYIGLMKTRTTIHANQRVVERLEDAGFSPDKIDQIGSALDYVAAKMNRSTALRFLDLDGMVGKAWTDRSNGDQAWAIIRNRRVITVMLRRSTQPATPAALKVEQVLDIKEIR